ncbi:hypothetical protein F383_28771 [Gossypium arboreum]|uniref:Uncharacterized protein n=1 Tax=Gossypium arboreum TaxID=29729 RepID=A0A0B0MWH6_GOSAR|nr:hypothetical protein F383_28771 [Gossypium arboreum]
MLSGRRCANDGRILPTEAATIEICMRSVRSIGMESYGEETTSGEAVSG